jgi:hypothetical protein
MRNIARLFPALLVGVGLLSIHQAWAATQSVSANIAFDTPLTLQKFADINFGTMTASNASTYRITTAGAITTIAGTGAYLYGATSTGFIRMRGGSNSETITVSVGGYTADQGVTPSNATCTDGFITPVSCANVTLPNANRNLILGVDVTADGTQAAGTSAAPSFTVTVVYN